MSYSHAAICISCDTCGASFNGHKHHPRGIFGDETLLRKEAREAGWTGSMTRASDDDKCPACAKGVSHDG